MNIELLGLKSREIIRILELYPLGSLEIKYESVFWCSDYSEPDTRNNPAGTPPGVPPNQQRNRSAAEVTRRVADSLGSMLGPIPRRGE